MKLEEIDLYVTNKCNLNCDFCSVQAKSCYEELSINKVKEIIDEATEYGIEDLHLTGGEPLVREDLEEIIQYAVDKNINVRLITNGTLLTQNRLKKLINSGLKSVMLSIDGTREYHDSVRGKGNYDRTMNSVELAISKNLFVRVNSVAWRDNMEEIFELIPTLNAMGVKVYSIFLGSPLGYAKAHKDNVIEPLVWQEFCKRIVDFVKINSIKTEIVVEKGFLFEDDLTAYNLNALKGRGRGCKNICNYSEFFQIKSNGDVYPCVFFSNEAEPIGNVNSNKISDIVERFKTSYFYRKIGCVPNNCIGCEQNVFCNGGCRGYAKLYTDNWFENDPRCNPKMKIIPLCPIVKLNVNKGGLGGSSEQALKV